MHAGRRRQTGRVHGAGPQARPPSHRGPNIPCPNPTPKTPGARAPHRLYEFFTRTARSAPCSAGCMASGCSTVAPKKASSVASSYVSSGTGAVPSTMRGSDVSTPACAPRPAHASRRAPRAAARHACAQAPLLESSGRVRLERAQTWPGRPTMHPLGRCATRLHGLMRWHG
jgi:hypothetical protein